MSTAPVGTGTPWRRLSPRMLLVHPVIEGGKALPAIVAALFAGGGGGSLWAACIAGVVIVFSIARWFTTTYAIDAHQIQVRQGVLRRRSLTARLDRVRTVDVTSHVLHRVLGIARVVIGTGTSDRNGRDRMVLDGLGMDQATRLRAELLHRDAPAPVGGAEIAHETVPPRDEVLAELDPRWIRFAPFTLTGAVTGLAVLGVVWRVVSEGHVHLDRVPVLRAAADRVERWSVVTDVLVGTAGVVAFVVVASTLGYALSFWHFTLARNPAGSLHVSRGLLTSRRTSIERRRLVGAELSEPLLLRWAGGARVLAVATGLRVGRGAERGGEILLPPAPVAVAAALAGAVFGDDASQFTVALTPHPVAALRRRMIRAVTAALVLTGVAALVVALADLSWVVVALAAVSLVLAVPLAVDRYRSLGHALHGTALVTRSGSIVRSRTVLDVQGVVGWTMHSSWFQRRLGLVTLLATTAAGRQRYAVHDVAECAAVALADAAVPDLLTQFVQRTLHGEAEGFVASGHMPWRGQG